MNDTPKIRCEWANSNELLIHYHDTEWGIPEHNDRKLFEMLNLEAMQAGLSWLTILKRRAAYRQAFDNFDAEVVSKYGQNKKFELLNNTTIIRNPLKINAIVDNAKAFLKVQAEYGSFNKYIWNFLNNNPESISKIMNQALKKQGFKFIGETTCYSFMQAIGMINDHSKNCFRYKMY